MRRKHIPLAVKLEVALLQLGLDPKRVRLDHHPPLALRMKRTLTDGTVVYSPDENDPRYLQWLSIEDHAVKTTGRRGTSKLSKRGGDISEIAKAVRLDHQREMFQRRMLDKRFDEALAIADKPKRSWPKRPFPKRAKPERTHGQQPRKRR